MAPNSPACSFIQASIAGSRSTAPLNRSNSLVFTSRSLEHNLQRKLDDPRGAGRVERAEICVHLPSLSVKASRGGQSGELGMVPGVEQPRPELHVPRLREQWDSLVDGDVPIVDTRPPHDAHTGVPEIP